MKFMLFVCHDETFDPPQELDTETLQWIKEVEDRGIRVLGHRLRPVTEAVTLHGGKEVEHAPTADLKQQIAGFDVLECADLKTATAAVATHPMARYGSIEIRPFWDE